MAAEKPEDAQPGYRRCPLCGEPTEMTYRPFCSARCRDIDLSQWLRGGYAIAGGQAAADEDGEDTAAGRGASSLSAHDNEEEPGA